MSNTYYDDGHCFVCGAKNELGMHLTFTWDSESRVAWTNLTFKEFQQGWNGVVHGGMISTVLDEVVVQAAGHEGHRCVTAQLTVKFRTPAYIGGTYKLEGRVVAVNRKIIDAEGTLVAEDGTVIASAAARLFLVSNRD